MTKIWAFFSLGILLSFLSSQVFGAGFVITSPSVGDDTLHAQTLYRDGRILAVGGSYNEGMSDGVLVRYLPKGELDLSFGKSGIAFLRDTGREILRAVALDKKERIIVSGEWAH